MTTSPAEIGLLLYPGVQLAALHGLTDLFQIAGKLVAQLGDGDAAGIRGRIGSRMPTAASPQSSLIRILNGRRDLVFGMRRHVSAG